MKAVRQLAIAARTAPRPLPPLLHLQASEGFPEHRRRVDLFAADVAELIRVGVQLVENLHLKR